MILKLGNDPQYCDYLIDDAKTAPVDFAVRAATPSPAISAVHRIADSYRRSSLRPGNWRTVFGLTFREWGWLILFAVAWNLLIVLPIRILTR